MSDVDRFFVGGEWIVPSSREVVPVLNPATEEPFATAVVPDRADAARAIEAARRAFDEGPWPRMAPKERAAYLRAAGAVLEQRRGELERLVIAEAGSTVALAKTVQVRWAIEAFEHAASWSESFAWETDVEPRTHPVTVRGLAVREPVGVVAGMTPFNYPLFTNCWKVAPAIAMGNTYVLKPSPWTPLDAFEVARACEEAGMPPGVVNVIGGGGVGVGQELASNPMVDMVAFTGSVAGGSAVAATAAATVKKVQLELGGKSVALVLDDASPEEVAGRLLGTCMLHAGQGCGNTTRLLVPASLHDATVDACVALFRSVKIGDPAERDTVIGPLIREEHRRRVEAHVRAGVDEGATIATGGRRPPHLDRGFFFEPTVFVGVRNEMRIAQEEIFGPVLCVIPYTTEDEAASIANDSVFGLGGAVMSPDRDRAIAVARRLRTGYVGVNGGMLNFNGSWGGYRRSGIGREWKLGLEEFTELKHVAWVEA